MAKRKKKKQKSSVGCLFWLLFFILIAAIFILNRETIAFVLEKTQAKNIVFKQEPEKENPKEQNPLSQIEIKKESPSKQEPRGDGSDVPTEPANTKPDQKEQPAQNESSRTSRQTAKPVKKPAAPQTQQIKKQPAIEKPHRKPTPQPKKPSPINQQKPVKKPQPATRTAVLYLVSVNADGTISRHSVKKTLPKSDSPMSDALGALFKASSNGNNLRSLIPQGTKLRSAWVKNGTAFINISDEFQYNQYGIDGYLAQLAQVVFTATEFSTVKSVQILIEGQKKEYLGAEGVWIGTPLSRASF